MSFNRENVTWQSADGTWNLAFFTVIWEGSEADGEDPEWDVEYDPDSFEWVSCGHRSQDAAYAAWPGASPGGTTIYPYATGDAWCAKYERMAKAWQATQPGRRAGRW